MGDEFPAWGRSAKDCKVQFRVSGSQGLSSDEAAERLQCHDPNKLADYPSPSLLKLLIQQLDVRLVLILLAASFLLALTSSAGELTVSDFMEPLVISLIIVANAARNIWQQTNAQKALVALRRIQSDHVTVRRDDKWLRRHPAENLVPGDIVLLRIGDKVPADMRVLRLFTPTLLVEQGILSGETATVNKTKHAVPEDASIMAKECMVFTGTTVVEGRASCLVVHTGMATEVGKIYAQIQEASQSQDNDTRLKTMLNKFGKAPIKIIALICALVWLINAKYFLTFEIDGWMPRNTRISVGICTYYFEIAVTFAIATIPKGLLTLIAICLALRSRKIPAKVVMNIKIPSLLLTLSLDVGL